MGNKSSPSHSKVEELEGPEDLAQDISVINQILRHPKMVKELEIHVNVKVVSDLNSIIRTKLWKMFLKNIKIRILMKKDELKGYMDVKINDFYSFNDMVTNLMQIVIGGEAFDNEINNKKSRNSAQNEQEENKMEEKDKVVCEEEDGNECCICFASKIQIILPCFHGYCENCCNLWIMKKEQGTCPLCRSEVPKTSGKFMNSAYCTEDENAIRGELKEMIFGFIKKNNPYFK